MNKEDKQIYLDYLKTLGNNSKVNFYDFAKKHRTHRKESINKAVKHYNKTIRDEKIKNYAKQKGYKFNNKDLTNIDSERLSYSTRNTGNAGQHFIFKGKIGDKILESLGPYIPTNEDFLKSTRNHEFYYTPGFSRRSRKLGGTNKIDNMEKFACGGKRRLANGGRQSLDNYLDKDSKMNLIALNKISEPTTKFKKSLIITSQMPVIKKKSSNNTIVQKSNKTQNSQSKNEITKIDLSEISITPSNNKSNNNLIDRRRLYKCGGKTKKAALGMSLTGGDIIGAGIGALGNIASGIIGLVGANKMKAPETPTLYQSAKLKTNYNISPQLAEIERTRQRSLDDVSANTASSVARLARNTGINLRSADAINNLYGEKENIETQLINQDRLNAQNVRNQNVQAYNQYLNQLNDFQNSKTAAKFNAIGSMVEGITGAAGDIITQGQQRYEDNQKLSAIIGSSEKNNLSYLIEAGYQPTTKQLDAAIASAKTQEEIDYYTKIKNRMSKSLFR